MKEMVTMVLPLTFTSLLLAQNDISKEGTCPADYMQSTPIDTGDLYSQETIFQEYRNTSHSVRENIDEQNQHPKQQVEKTNTIKQMFIDARLSGQLKMMYASYLYDLPAKKDQYATAVGGTLKYKLARYEGFNAAVAVSTSQDLNFATGERHTDNQNPELSSKKGKYTLLSQAYLNYNFDSFNFRAGRQVIDTPLADSDEIRMNPNTFEAYIATYKLDNLTFTAGNLQRWQGYDAGLDNGFVKVGTDGTWLASVAFSNSSLDSGIWYYNVSGITNAAYADASWHYGIGQNTFLHANAQYLYENELSGSNVSANIYGGMGQVVFKSLGFSLAYNQAFIPRNKKSFSGFGGGTLYTSMDTMILDNIAVDRDASAIVANISYNFKHLNILYAYGNFFGDANSGTTKANIIEQDMKTTYNFNDKLDLSILYAIYNDTTNPNDSTAHWKRIQMMLAYNF